jgi:hypothetical protein
MIACQKCQESNPPDAEHCQRCGADLLPGESFKDRLIYIFGGVFGFLLSLGMLYFLGKNPDIGDQFCLFTNPAAWFIGLFLFPVSALVSTLRKTPIHKRYELRANRLKGIDADQAIADLSEAINLAPEKQKAGLLKQRAEIFKSLGKEEDAIEDRLTYMESEGAYQGQANFAQTFKLDSEQFISSARESERKQLLGEGKIMAVGFCKQCQRAVELDAKLRCELHPKKKPIIVKYTLPKNLEAMIVEVEQEGAKEYKKTKRTRTIILIALGVGSTLCCLIPALMGYFSNLTG